MNLYSKSHIDPLAKDGTSLSDQLVASHQPMLTQGQPLRVQALKVETTIFFKKRKGTRDIRNYTGQGKQTSGISLDRILNE